MYPLTLPFRPGKLDYLFLIHKLNPDFHADFHGHFPLFIIKENTPNQAVILDKAF